MTHAATLPRRIRFIALLVVAAACGGEAPTRPAEPKPEAKPEAPPRVLASIDTVTLLAGDSIEVSAAVVDAKGDTLTFLADWTVLTPGLLEYKDGIVVTWEAGEGLLRVASGAAADTVRLTITPRPPMRARLSRPIAVNEWAYLDVDQGGPIRGTASYTFASSDTSVVDVLPDGRVIAYATGTATISVRRLYLGGTRGDTATLPVTVAPAPEWQTPVSVEYSGGYVPTPREDRQIRMALRRWQNVVVRPPVDPFVVDIPAHRGACNPTDASIHRSFDGIRVFVTILPDSLAGPGVGAYGGWCAADQDGFPRAFSVEIVERFVVDVRLGRHVPEYFEAVVAHELGHGFGIVNGIAEGRPSYRVTLPDGSFVFAGPATVAAYRELTGYTAVTTVPLAPDGAHLDVSMSAPEIREVMAGGGRITALSLGVIADQGSPVRIERAEGPPPALPGPVPPTIWLLRASDHGELLRESAPTRLVGLSNLAIIAR